MWATRREGCSQRLCSGNRIPSYCWMSLRKHTGASRIFYYKVPITPFFIFDSFVHNLLFFVYHFFFFCYYFLRLSVLLSRWLRLPLYYYLAHLIVSYLSYLAFFFLIYLITRYFHTTSALEYDLFLMSLFHLPHKHLITVPYSVR